MINNRAREIAASDYSDRQSQIDSTLMNLHTALPAIVMSYDANTRTVTAQIAIQRVFTDGEGLNGPINLPPCVDVPVIFPGGGGYEVTFPVKEGDECLLIFSERCIDSWFISGEISPPADYRQHDLSDAIAIMGLKSLNNLEPTDTAGMKIGGADNKISITDSDVSITVNGKKQVSLSDKSINLSMNGEGGVTSISLTSTKIDASVNGALLSLDKKGLTTNVPIRCPNLITDDIDVNKHKHSGVEIGAGETMGPKN